MRPHGFDDSDSTCARGSRWAIRFDAGGREEPAIPRYFDDEFEHGPDERLDRRTERNPNQFRPSRLLLLQAVEPYHNPLQGVAVAGHQVLDRFQVFRQRVQLFVDRVESGVVCLRRE
jgi:hypothetical protein